MTEAVLNAIKEKRLLSFTYQGQRRVVEPHIYGRNAAGNDILTAWFVQGYSESLSVPGWRSYLVSEARDLVQLDEMFEHPRPGFNPSDPHFVQVYASLETS